MSVPVQRGGHRLPRDPVAARQVPRWWRPPGRNTPPQEFVAALLAALIRAGVVTAAGAWRLLSLSVLVLAAVLAAGAVAAGALNLISP